MNKYQEYQKALDKIKTELWELYGWVHCEEETNTLQKLVDTVNLLKSKLYLPEENDCDTLDDGSKVYMIYAKGVWSEEEYKALKEVLGDE